MPPSISVAIASIEVCEPLICAAHHASATSNPAAVDASHDNTTKPDDATNPGLAATLGSAKMPAPTIFPATRAAAVRILSRGCPWSSASCFLAPGHRDDADGWESTTSFFFAAAAPRYSLSLFFSSSTLPWSEWASSFSTLSMASAPFLLLRLPHLTTASPLTSPRLGRRPNPEVPRFCRTFRLRESLLALHKACRADEDEHDDDGNR
mmetsp:Transcript_23575/g.32922  ORF Transcript_23575/g.32922 Transcript_23575/m.32922 type:complete len:208 (+) Transcript_23575:1705-2328(+)